MVSTSCPRELNVLGITNNGVTFVDVSFDDGPTLL